VIDRFSIDGRKVAFEAVHGIKRKVGWS
jgi:hypothetical protein